MKTKKQEVVGFSFQAIPLHVAQSMATAGNGKYSDLIAKLLEVLPDLKPDEGYAFGLPKGEVKEEDRHRICFVLNSRLRQSRVFWRITYSGNKRLFVCIPRKRTYKKHKGKGGTNGVA